MNIATKPKKAKAGTCFDTNSGSSLVVLHYENAKTIVVEFKDGRTHPFIANIGNLRKGKYKNPYSTSVCGKGFLGVGKFTYKNEKRAHMAWVGVMTRVYSEKELKRRPSTHDLTVCEEWHNFQIFAKWFMEQEGSNLDGWHLDKDLIVSGNSHYSPETCCLLPSEINTILPKRQGKSDRVYRKRDGGWQIQVKGTCGTRSTLVFRDYKEACEEKVKNQSDLLKFYSEKYKCVLSISAYKALRSWSGYPNKVYND